MWVGKWIRVYEWEKRVGAAKVLQDCYVQLYILVGKGLLTGTYVRLGRTVFGQAVLP